THNVAEPAGALALAAQRHEGTRGGRVGLVLTGGNVDGSMLAEILAGKTPDAV
ncbi:MAG: hypothetical protein JO303_12605, partial [Caulobacteraceae bacterium]|nr:hypothetical protein [Caulobacteraceae bacterium]